MDGKNPSVEPFVSNGKTMYDIAEDYLFQQMLLAFNYNLRAFSTWRDNVYLPCYAWCITYEHDQVVDNAR